MFASHVCSACINQKALDPRNWRQTFVNHHMGAGKASSLEEQCILLTAEPSPGSSVMLERFQEGRQGMPPPQLQLRDLLLRMLMGIFLTTACRHSSERIAAVYSLTTASYLPHPLNCCDAPRVISFTFTLFVPVPFHPTGVSVMSPLSLAVMLSWP